VIDYVIPGNDDAIRSGALLCRLMADAVTEGRLHPTEPSGHLQARLPPPPTGPR